jgi:hypothetical protein
MLTSAYLARLANYFLDAELGPVKIALPAVSSVGFK